jgi:hypothetical protein
MKNSTSHRETPRKRQRKSGNADDGGEESQTTVLIDMAKKRAELWYDEKTEKAYATFMVGDHCENWTIDGSKFRKWLSKQYYEKTSRAPGSTALKAATNTIAGIAEFDGERKSVYLRSAEFNGKIYIDLCDEHWRAVEIDSDDWRIAENCPVNFRRAKGMWPLAEPERGGDIEILRRFINVTDEDWPLVKAWLVSAIRPEGPYATAALHGEQGSAKSTTARVLRDLVDPNKAPIGSAPKNSQDLAIMANNSWVIGLDNLSRVSNELSDNLCRLATGGGFRTRAHYENDIEAGRPGSLSHVPSRDPHWRIARTAGVSDRTPEASYLAFRLFLWEV